MPTIEQIEEQIRALVAQKEQMIDLELETKIYTMFSAMTKDEVLLKIKEMMDSSSMLKSEVKRLLIDVNNTLL